MSKIKHTPGPWFVLNGTDVFTDLGAANASGIHTDDNDGWHIADCSTGGSSVGDQTVDIDFMEQQANARLIAAAPDLLEALVGMVAIAADSTGVAGYHLNGAVADWDEFEEAAAAIKAIAKATGEES